MKEQIGPNVIGRKGQFAFEDRVKEGLQVALLHWVAEAQSDSQTQQSGDVDNWQRTEALV